MATTTPLGSDRRRSYSWWWDSHISPKNSKWLQENLTDMDSKVKVMIKLIEEDADSFARRAEMYYKKRPELMTLVEEFYRAYRALAERYDHAARELRLAHKTIAQGLDHDQVSIVLSDYSPSPLTPPRPYPRSSFDFSSGLQVEEEGEVEEPENMEQQVEGEILRLGISKVFQALDVPEEGEDAAVAGNKQVSFLHVLERIKELKNQSYRLSVEKETLSRTMTAMRSELEKKDAEIMLLKEEKSSSSSSSSSEDNWSKELKEMSKEAEAASFYFDLQIWNVREVLYENKVQELSETCRAFENRISLMEHEIGGLKAQLSSNTEEHEEDEEEEEERRKPETLEESSKDIQLDQVSNPKPKPHFNGSKISETLARDSEKLTKLKTTMMELRNKNLEEAQLQEVDEAIDQFTKLNNQMKKKLEEKAEEMEGERGFIQKKEMIRFSKNKTNLILKSLLIHRSSSPRKTMKKKKGSLCGCFNPSTPTTAGRISMS